MQTRQISEHIWNSRYRHVLDSGAAEQDIGESWRRVSTAVAAVEDDQEHWRQSFEEILTEYRFLPGGRILAGAGTGRHITLFNCFVMGSVADSIKCIFESFKESALTMQQGGGIGCDFSTLRPRWQPRFGKWRYGLRTTALYARLGTACVKLFCQPAQGAAP